VNLKTLILLSSAAAALVACGAYDHRVSGDDGIGALDQKSLHESVVGTWVSKCKPSKAQSKKAVVDFQADGTAGLSDRHYTREDCTGQYKVAAGERYAFTAQHTKVASGNVNLKAQVSLDKIKDGEMSETNLHIAVGSNGQKLIMKCRTANIRGQNVNHPEANCGPGSEVYTRDDWQ
jgi:hypothetical protein